MSRKDKDKAKGDAGKTPEQPPPDVKINERSDNGKATRRTFPGPGNAHADVPLRMAMDRDAMAELSSHARENTDREICGVLAGEVCEDDHGRYVHVQAAVRGKVADQGSVHVTYTHETWNQIFAEMDAKYPKLKIVGWYHSHPGFGVQFSDMDAFIHKNFFGADHNVALVIDPLGGQTAVCINRDGEIDYLAKFWLDGREQQCWQLSKKGAPGAEAGVAGAEGGSAMSADVHELLDNMDRRLTQVLQALDETRNDFYRTLLFTFTLIVFAVVGMIGWQVWKYATSDGMPPKTLGNYSQLIDLDGKKVRLAFEVKQYDIPPEISARQLAEDRIRAYYGDLMARNLQAFQLSLSYQLSRDKLDPTRYQLPVPPQSEKELVETIRRLVPELDPNNQNGIPLP